MSAPSRSRRARTCGRWRTSTCCTCSHMWQEANKYYKEDQPIPISMCFGVPPACTLLAGAGFDYAILPIGCEEIGIAGALQGEPSRVISSPTVASYNISDPALGREVS